MGKCVSKHPTSVTIPLSERDLAEANRIWSKFADSNEYISSRAKNGNQLPENRCDQSDHCGGRDDYCAGKRIGDDIVKISLVLQQQQLSLQQRSTTSSQQQVQERQHLRNDLSSKQEMPQQQLYRLPESKRNKTDNDKGNDEGEGEHRKNNNSANQSNNGHCDNGEHYQKSTETEFTEVVDKAIYKDQTRLNQAQLKPPVPTPESIMKKASSGLLMEAPSKILLNRKIDDNVVVTVVDDTEGTKFDQVGKQNMNDIVVHCENIRDHQQHHRREKRREKGKSSKIICYKNEKYEPFLQSSFSVAPEQLQTESSSVATSNDNNNNNENNNNNKTRMNQVLRKSAKTDELRNDNYNNDNLQQQQQRQQEQSNQNLGARLGHQKQSNQRKNKHNQLLIESADAGSNKNYCRQDVAATAVVTDNRYRVHVRRVCANIWTQIQGQTESKKLFKKLGTGAGTDSFLETKGTAMSFGFRKKLNTTPKKVRKQKNKQDQCNNFTTNTTICVPTGIGIAIADDADVCDNSQYTRGIDDSRTIDDNNGNIDQRSNIQIFEKVGAVAAAKTARACEREGITANNEAHKQQQQQQPHRPGAENRFGFRGVGLVRPASTGLTTQRYQSGDELRSITENNNVENVGGSQKILPYKSNLKRRSKSAHSARSMASNQSAETEYDDDTNLSDAPKITQPKTITFNLNHNTIEYQRRQFFEQTPLSPSTRSTHYKTIHTGIHTNAIVRPTPRLAPPPVTFTKFTLQTTNLPKPEYPVPIRVTVAAPTATPTAPTHSSSAAATTLNSNTQGVAASNGRGKDLVDHMDQKTAKQMANNNRRGFSGTREISADSGIASLDITLGDSSASSGGGGVRPRYSSSSSSSPKRSRSRPRNLQMVMNGRHKFQVRDLDDPLSSESSIVEPLALPKLPSEHQTSPLPLSGLVRSNTILSRESITKSGTISGVGLRNGERQERDSFGLGESKGKVIDEQQQQQQQMTVGYFCSQIEKQNSEETDSIEEEKLHIDSSTSEKNDKRHQKFHDVNTYSSKTSSGTSSRASSWCNAGESMAIKDCSSLSFSSSEDSNKLEISLQMEKADFSLNRVSHGDDDRDALNDRQNNLNIEMQINPNQASFNEPQPIVLPALQNHLLRNELNRNIQQQQRPSLYATTDAFAINQELSPSPPPAPSSSSQSLFSSLTDSKFAEIAAAGSEFLLDDETSPTVSLVSSSDSDNAACKRQKHRANEEIQEKDIDEISPELDVASPISPGTPTHASHSLSLSDCGNLIDDEIADQPGLLFNRDSVDDAVAAEHSLAASHRGGHSDTPTLMDSQSLQSQSLQGQSLKTQSLISQSGKGRSVLQQAIELSLRTPMSLRKAVMDHADSLNTLSPCDSICSDDLMMDFEVNSSSMDSIDRSLSVKSRSGSDLNRLNESSLLATEFNKKGNGIMKELSTILNAHKGGGEGGSVIAHIPTTSTRLLNRSRLQQQCLSSSADSESPKSMNSVQRRSTASRSSSSSLQHHCGREVHSSSDDLMLYDKSFRNAMIQDVLQFKRQLLRLRKILQETETLNPFESENGPSFTTCSLDGTKVFDNNDLVSSTSSTNEDPLQELTDLRRQVVYLQGQVDDRDHTIRLQRYLIEKLETETEKPLLTKARALEGNNKECIHTATQTDRTRPLSIGADGLSSKPEYTSYTTYFPFMNCNDSVAIIQQQQQQHQRQQLERSPEFSTPNNQTRRHTVISATFTNYNHLQQQQQQLQKQLQPQPQQQQQSTVSLSPRRTSIGWESPQRGKDSKMTIYSPTITTTITPTTQTSIPTTYKPVKITLIGEPLPMIKQDSAKSSSDSNKTCNKRHNNRSSSSNSDANSNDNSKRDVNCSGNTEIKSNCNGYNADNGQLNFIPQQQQQKHQPQPDSVNMRIGYEQSVIPTVAKTLNTIRKNQNNEMDNKNKDVCCINGNSTLNHSTEHNHWQVLQMGKQKQQQQQQHQPQHQHQNQHHQSQQQSQKFHYSNNISRAHNGNHQQPTITTV